MIRTHILKAQHERRQLDALNQESGRLYTLTMVWHWRIYRRQGKWIAPRQAERLGDSLHGGTTLHAHSCDAAQQAFYKACKTARTNRHGESRARFPYRRKRYRTTYWKKTGIRLRNGIVFLARARGLKPVQIRLPYALLPEAEIVEVRLVFNHKAKGYEWHLVVDDHQEMPPAPGAQVAGLDLGEIHPAVVATADEACVFTARELRSIGQYRNKKQAAIRQRQVRCVKKSRMWWRLQRRWNRIRRACERRQRDILNKVSRAVIEWCVAHRVGVLVIGDVRDITCGKRLGRKSQQKVSQWAHGQLRDYLTYKATERGIRVELQSERYTTQTCPACGDRYKPSGRTYQCRACGLRMHRDIVGAANIRTAYLVGSPGGACPQVMKFHRPFQKYRDHESRRPVDTGQVAGFGRKSSLPHQAA